MATRNYTASLNQSQGQSGYSIIFRHPAMSDETTGKQGPRVRRGLGTSDKAEAERLRDELNELLADSRYCDPAARAEAERRFDSRVVNIYFHKMSPEEVDFRALRDESIPLPPRGLDGHRYVALLGTTGAGKTTLVRQLIGTDPSRERFPSTSTSRTTIHDTEIILDDKSWRAVVTFASADEVREHLNECIHEAVRTIAKDKKVTDSKVLKLLLNHVNQRVRFNYVLGNGPKTEGNFDFDDEDDEIEGDAEPSPMDDIDEVDLAATNELLGRSVARLRDLARLWDRLNDELGASDTEEDKRVVEEMLEEELDNDETFHEIADALMDEIEKRFDLLPPGKVTKTPQGWPLTWKGDWPVGRRSEFLKSVSRFSSNDPRRFGQLLTPLVNGVRVAGPFSPTWENGQTPKLVLFDGEGLGHKSESSPSVSTSVSRLIKAVDAVLLVDNAKQSMLAAPHAAMRELASTGSARKLILAFTHFDQDEGDNLLGRNARAEHVMESVRGVLADLRERLGPNAAESIFRERLDTASFFLERLQKRLSDDKKKDRHTVDQLRKLLGAIDQVIERPELTEARPVYDRTKLADATRSAAGAFLGAWRLLLGLESKPGVTKEHWTRVKALNRRLATMNKDEYDTLRPVADLRRELLTRIYPFIQTPLRWEGPEPSEDERQSKYDALADRLGERLLNLSTRRVWRDPIDVWRRAYRESGSGSTRVRAFIIDSSIYEPAAAASDRTQFLREVVAEVEAAAEESGAKLQ